MFKNIKIMFLHEKSNNHINFYRNDIMLSKIDHRINFTNFFQFDLIDE